MRVFFKRLLQDSMQLHCTYMQHKFLDDSRLESKKMEISRNFKITNQRLEEVLWESALLVYQHKTSVLKLNLIETSFNSITCGSNQLGTGM